MAHDSVPTALGVAWEDVLGGLANVSDQERLFEESTEPRCSHPELSIRIVPYPDPTVVEEPAHIWTVELWNETEKTYFVVATETSSDAAMKRANQLADVIGTF